MNGSDNSGDHTPSPHTCNSNTFPRGAPRGNRNALKHGRYTREMLALRAEARLNLQKIKTTLAMIRVQMISATLSHPSCGEVARKYGDTIPIRENFCRSSPLDDPALTVRIHSDTTRS
jgi:hypothetical protein